MVSSVQYSKGVLVFLICQVWLPSFASSQSSTVTASSATMAMATSSVSMTTDSTTNVMSSTMASSSSSGSTSSASTSSYSAPMTTTAASVTSSVAMSESTSMASASIASTMTTDSTSMSSMSTSSLDSSTMAWSSNSTISCRSFNCDSNCYWMFMNMSSSPCPSNSNYCELRKLNDSMYSVGCADSCDLNSNGCANDSQISCVKDCCNTTDCLNATLQNMERTTETTVVPTTKTAMTTMQPTNQPVTQPSNGKMCKYMTCIGADCYIDTDPPKKSCYGQDNYCELKKETEGSVITWMAGCTNDCTEETACTSSAQTCHQECCEASDMGDCLKLDGKVAMPNSDASRAIFSPLMLLVTTLMAWLVMGDQL